VKDSDALIIAGVVAVAVLGYSLKKPVEQITQPVGHAIDSGAGMLDLFNPNWWVKFIDSREWRWSWN